MIITFKNAPITINGVTKYATEGTITEDVSFSRIDELANHNVSTNNSSRPKGTLSVNYYLNDSDESIRNLTGIKFVSGSIGDLGFSSGLMSKYSISVKPNELIRATLDIDFYHEIDRNFPLGNAPTIQSLAHGGSTQASGLVFNTNLFNFEYSISQSISPDFALGGQNIIGANIEDGSITCQLVGSGLGNAVEFGCSNDNSIVLNLKTLCNNTLGSIVESGMKITSSQLSLDNEQGAVGTVNLIKYF